MRKIEHIKKNNSRPRVTYKGYRRVNGKAIPLSAYVEFDGSYIDLNPNYEGLDEKEYEEFWDICCELESYLQRSNNIMEAFEMGLLFSEKRDQIFAKVKTGEVLSKDTNRQN